MSDSCETVQRLRARGLIDFHFDLPMELLAKRDQPNLFQSEYLPQLEEGGIGLFVAAIYIEDKNLPNAFQVALDQIECMRSAAERSGRAVVCRSFAEIEATRAGGKIAIIFGMEGAEPIGTDLENLRRFHNEGVRLLGLTHARSNAAGHGGRFGASGSSPEGLTSFGRELVSLCEELGIIIDLAHINPAGFDEILSLTKRTPIVSHSNARRFYDIERNMSDDQIRMIGKRGGVIGVNTVLVSPVQEKSTLDGYIDHIEHIVDLIGIDGVAVGFDFFEFIFRQWPAAQQRELAQKLAEPNFLNGLRDHSDAPNLVRKLLERGFSEEDAGKFLFGNWERVLRDGSSVAAVSDRRSTLSLRMERSETAATVQQDRRTRPATRVKERPGFPPRPSQCDTESQRHREGRARLVRSFYTNARPGNFRPSTTWLGAFSQLSRIVP